MDPSRWDFLKLTSAVVSFHTVKPRILTQNRIAALCNIALAAVIGCTIAVADEPASFDQLAEQYERDIRPLLRQYCLDCHVSPEPEGDLDLEQFAMLTDVRRATRTWLKVDEMLAIGEMPPEDSEQPSPEQRKRIRGWLQRYLHAEALANAGYQ